MARALSLSFGFDVSRRHAAQRRLRRAARARPGPGALELSDRRTDPRLRRDGRGQGLFRERRRPPLRRGFGDRPAALAEGSGRRGLLDPCGLGRARLRLQPQPPVDRSRRGERQGSLDFRLRAGARISLGLGLLAFLAYGRGLSGPRGRRRRRAVRAECLERSEALAAFHRRAGPLHPRSRRRRCVRRQHGRQALRRGSRNGQAALRVRDRRGEPRLREGGL